MTAMSTVSRVTTTAHEARLARQVLDGLEGMYGVLALEDEGGQAVPVPDAIVRLVREVLDAVARGGTVTVGSVPEVLTTSSAASILGVSRPTVMKMIREGRLPAHKVGTHHRLRTDDVYAVLRERRARERAAFEELLELEGDDGR